MDQPDPPAALKPIAPSRQELTRSLSVYRFALPFAAALLLPGFLRRMFRRGNFQSGFGQRLGRFEPGDCERLKSRRWLWIRSISVGETLVALKLARTLKVAVPEISVVLSVTTSTGYALALAEAADELFPMYNPVDSQRVVRRTLDLIRPIGLVLVEGEIWPNLMADCDARGIPVMLANARLSPRSAGRFAKSKRWVAPFFRLLEWVGIPDEEDRARWEAVGVAPERLHLTGSVKFDQTAKVASRVPELRQLLSASGMPEDAPLWVAGSTHEGEEVLLVECLKRLRLRHPTLRLAIAPRHVERVPRLLAELEALQVAVVLRSTLPSSAPWEVLLVDTTGELTDWYALASVTFVGKSLTASGGQNPVEPALAGKAVIFGPHMENFEAVVRLLLAAEGAVQVPDAPALEEAVLALLENPHRCEALGENAIHALRGHQGATARTVELVLQTCRIR